MRNKQLYNYMLKVFISYFLAIGIPISILSVTYIALTVPQVTKEQYAQYQKKIGDDMQKMMTIGERINDFSYMMVSDNALREAQKGSYEEMVFYYGQLMERLRSFSENSNATTSAAIYIAGGNRIFSPDFGICQLEEYKEKQRIYNLLNGNGHRIFSTSQNGIVLTTTLPRYYFDSSVVLQYTIKLDNLYTAEECENVIIFAPDGSILYTGSSVADVELDTQQIEQGAGEIASVNLDGKMLWYQVEPNLGLTVGRLYNMDVVDGIVRSTVVLAISMLAASLLFVCLIAFLLARAHVRPVAKLSAQLRQVNGGTAGKSVFENISDFLADVQKQNDAYKQTVLQSKEIVRDGAIRHLIWGRIPAEYSASEFLSRAGIDRLPQNLVPVLIQTGSNISKAKFSKTAELNILVKNIAEEHLSMEYKIFGSTMLELDQIVFIVDGDSTVDIGRLAQLLEEIAGLLMQKLSLGIRAAVGHSTDCSEALCQCFIGMRKLLNSSAYRSQNVVTLFEDNQQDGQLPEYLRSSMVAAIKQGNQASVEMIFHQLIDVELKRYPEEEAVGLAFVVVSNVLSNLTEYPELVEQADFDLFKIFSQNIAQDEKYARLCERLLRVAQKFANQMAETEDNTHIGNALEYIQNNLNHDLPLSDIAQYLGINTSYFSRIFKTSIGVTPLQYITNLRMEKAKALLRDERVTIKEISEMLGYNDTRSFIRFFKKSEGRTPSEYRGKGEQE